MCWRVGNAQLAPRFIHREVFGLQLPSEYVEVLSEVVRGLATDVRPPLRTANKITEWLHKVAAQDVRDALINHKDTRMRRVVQCILERTHHPLLSDWTPEQITDWCRRTRLLDVEVALGVRGASNSH